jgi:hypothetical protein
MIVARQRREESDDVVNVFLRQGERLDVLVKPGRTTPAFGRFLTLCSKSFAGCSMPRHLSVHNNLSTIFVHLDDGITPTQLRFNMSQLTRKFRVDRITPHD